MGEDAEGESNGNLRILTKVILIENVSRAVNVSHKEAAIIVERILDSMVAAIQRGDKVEIRGFGSFRTRPRRARTGRNPRTGVPVEVPAKRIPFFTPSKAIREALGKG
jgi:integration host factor subunit beta